MTNFTVVLDFTETNATVEDRQNFASRCENRGWIPDLDDDRLTVVVPGVDWSKFLDCLDTDVGVSPYDIDSIFDQSTSEFLDVADAISDEFLD